MTEGRSLDRIADPRVRALAMAMSRRTMLRGVAAGGAAAAASSLLAACGTSPAVAPASSEGVSAASSAGVSAASSAGVSAAPDKSDTEKVVNFSNWQAYIDVDAKDANKRPSVDQFKAKTGITVTYTEDVNDNDSFYAKILPQLRAGQDTGRDLFALTDWMAARLIRQKFVQKLDKTQIPNVTANLIDSLKTPSWDPTRDFSAPWQSGTTGIAYLKNKVPAVKTITELLTRPDLKGRVTVLTEWRDTIGLILLEQGKDPANVTDDDYSAAIAMLQKANDSGQLRGFTGNEYKQQITAGTLYACLAWSGDIVQAQVENANVTWSQPEAGMMIWADNMMIPNQAQHTKNAEKVMNWYYDPAIAAEVAAYVQYICPVKGAKEAMTKIDKTLVDNPLIFPTKEFLAKTHIFKGLDEATETKYAAQFNKVKGA